MQQHPRYTEPAADFSDALLVIRDYHAHFFALCEGLAQLVEEIELRAISVGFSTRARQLRHDFMVAFALHHHDEEHTLFPCVKHSSRLVLDEILRQVEAEHLEIDLVWNWLMPLLQDTGQIHVTSTARNRPCCPRSSKCSRRHNGSESAHRCSATASRASCGNRSQAGSGHGPGV